MTRTTRFAAILSALAAMAAGCSSTEPTTSTSDVPSATTASASAEANDASSEMASEGASEASTTAATFPQHYSTSAGDITIKEAPKKIAVLEYGALDTIDALGLNDLVVAIPMSVDKEGLAKTFPNAKDVGQPRELDLETLAVTEPDLVITGIRSQEVGKELASQYTVYDDSIDYSNYVDSVIQVNTDLANILGASDKATEKLDAIKASADALKAAAKDKGTAMVVMTSGGEVSTFGTNNRMSSLVFDIAGMKPAFEVTKNDRHGQVITYEAIREANPDYLFVYDRDTAIGKEDAQSAKVLLDNDLVKATNAAKNNHIFYPETFGQYITVHGLNNTKAMIDQLTEALSK
ncbi:ABC transporter substrate-binding protein [Stomatohabitans albus]|uniref:ABC transporter substrate-binding protein n=1 Tax=Stomatohabitans albus TaxID=3110766 RepID=UPI00300C9125